MTRDETKAFMGELRNVYGEQFYRHGVTSSSVTIWAVALSEVSFQDAIAAIAQHMKQSVFPPKPKEIIDIVALLHPRLGMRRCPGIEKFKTLATTEVKQLEQIRQPKNLL